MASEAPAWFVATVVDGLQRLRALHLPGAPPAETVKLSGQAWIDALWLQPVGWQEALDRPRLCAAFLALSAAVDQWPSPKQLLQQLPARPTPAKLPAPAPSPAELTLRAQKLAQLKALLNGSYRPLQPDTPVKR